MVFDQYFGLSFIAIEGQAWVAAKKDVYQESCLIYVCRILRRNTSSAPPKLAHIFRAQKQRYFLEIVFAKRLSRGNRTRQGFSHFDIIHFRPSDDVLGLRIDFVLCFIKCAVKRGSLFVVAAKILCKSHCTGYCATNCAVVVCFARIA